MLNWVPKRGETRLTINVFYWEKDSHRLETRSVNKRVRDLKESKDWFILRQKIFLLRREKSLMPVLSLN